ncbi:ATP-binding cassette subfamily B protein [Stackebrandtia albiflava]|uniref:ATP-binding cassette subfamily B protein n=1 Tax=Stackebrandtia albiflava TaxID=406432 RepID=A0A562UQ41_9ACTN|nr:ABC transporter ATP-binding protein [Stackebrandtia albiflava]TWJ07729.1 ATP-binding cassette subfamily B protein [Stackebrandtia albiflava]
MFVNRTLLGFARPAWPSLTLTVLAGAAASGAGIGVAFSLAATVSTVLGARQTTADITTPLLLTAGFTVARAGFLWLRDQSATTTAITVKRRIRLELMEKVFRLGPRRPGRRGAGEIRASVVDGVEGVQAYVGFYLPHLVVTLLVPVTLVGIVAVRSLPVALVIAAGVATVPLAQRLWSRLLGERAHVHWDAFARYAAKLTDSVRGITTLASLGAAGRRATALAVEAERLREATNANLRSSLGVSVVTGAAMSIGTAGATVLAAFEAAAGRLAVGDVVLVLFLAVECFRPLQELQNYWHEGFHGVAAAKGIQEIRDAEPVVADTGRLVPSEPIRAPRITFDDVTYRHPGSDRDALSAVSFSVPGGATLAVVGRSGAGKSTLVQLLTRDVDPSAGRVLLDDTDLVAYPLAVTRALAARVSQDIVLLDGTIRQNVMAARPTATEAEFTDAVQRARVDEFAGDSPDGYDAAVGEGGTLLSGGQRQRVALARALLADSPVLVLDEATSALDAENEAVITDAVHDDRGRRTTVIVAHRLSTVVDADYVLVLDEGRVAEFGPPALLAAANGHWAALLAAHSSGLDEALTR